ncbi:MAG: peptidylprolyl isomerase [Deltaproteobacteria bacterium]|nr:peptidylprolyl isomerase [Deltaproteobacteria bacterium]
MKIAQNSFVKIDYLIRLDQDESYPPDGRPEELSFCLGLGVMPPGLEQELIGMEPGQNKAVRLTPDQAYGEVDQDLIMEVDRQDFEPGLELEPGMVFETLDEQKQPVYFMVSELRGDRVVIDFNHPLAGRELEIDVTIREVREASPEDLKPHHDCSCPSCGGGRQD